MTTRFSAGAILTLGSLLLTGCGGGGTTGALSPSPMPSSLSGDGPFEVASYSDFPDAAEFGDATIYYPVDVPDPVGGVAIAPGFTERQSHIEWWGPRLASHGFAVLTLDTNDPRDRPEIRSEALIAAIRLLQAENRRTGSPLVGRIDPGRMAVMGHSMGGGGALLAADELGDDIQAAIPFTPWQPDGDFDGITAPTLVIAGSADEIAGVAEHAFPHYQSIPSSTPKVYMELDGGGHFLADTNRGEDLPTIGRYAIAWLKLYVDDDERYRDLIYGDAQESDAAMFSRYVENP